MEDEKVEQKEEEKSQGLIDLEREGAEEHEEVKADDEKKDDEKVDDTADDGVDPAELIARMDSLETKLDERDAEITFLRGELSKRAEKSDTTKASGDEINLDEVVAALVDKDPKVSAKKIIELAEKIADKKVAGMRDETGRLLTSSQQINSLKETDRQNVLNDFSEDGYLEDPQFVKVMTELFQNTNKAAGRYIPDSLHLAASSAKVIIDKARAAKTKGKNGVREVRPVAPRNPVEADTHDYSKAKSINDLPMSDSEKAAARGVVSRLKARGDIKNEAEWVDSWLKGNAQ